MTSKECVIQIFIGSSVFVQGNATFNVLSPPETQQTKGNEGESWGLFSISLSDLCATSIVLIVKMGIFLDQIKRRTAELVPTVFYKADRFKASDP